MAKRDLYSDELAETVFGLFAIGETTPSAMDIAVAHFPGKALGGEITEGVRKRLGKIRDLLDEDGFSVCLVSDTYYRRFRRVPPATMADARRCIPLGYGKAKAGVHLTSGDDDLIWQASEAQNFAAGAGKVKKAVDRTLKAVEGGRLSDEHAGQMLVEAARRAAPDRPEIAARVTKALPPATIS